MKESIRRLYKYKICFYFVLLSGSIAHAFRILMPLNNHDNIANTPSGYGGSLAVGRWFLNILGDMVEKYWGGDKFTCH